jgi:hypothetical protein
LHRSPRPVTVPSSPGARRGHDITEQEIVMTAPALAHPLWCNRRDCTAVDGGPHLGQPLIIASAEDDLTVTVRSGLWPAESSLPAAPVVQVSLHLTGFVGEPTVGSLSSEDAEALARELLAAAAKARASC